MLDLRSHIVEGWAPKIDPFTAHDPRQVGRWRLEGRLGAGGMGVVYLGRAENRVAAVKVIAPSLAADRTFRPQFRRDLEVCGRVRGPQVAELYDSESFEAIPWLATRYVAGPTLDEAVTATGPLHDEPIRAFALAVAEALRQIHASGVLHRNLKPSNVILADETPVVIDFGIAPAADAASLTATATDLGPAGWMPPEQIEGRPIGTAADVFAWGAVVAYAATGRPPFGTGRTEAVVYRVLYQPPDLDGVPSEILPAVRAALAVDEHDRPTIAAVIESLARGTTAGAVADVITTAWVAPMKIGGPAVARRPQRRVTSKSFVFRIAVVAVILAFLGVTVAAMNGQRGSTGATTPTTIETPTTLAGSSAAPTSTPTATAPTVPTTLATTVPTTGPPVASFVDRIDPATDDINRFIAFSQAHQQNVAMFDVRFPDPLNPRWLDVQPEYEPSVAYLFAQGACPQGPPACGSGLEVLVSDLSTVPGASLSYERGEWVLRGRFAIQAVSGSDFGVMSIGLRAVPTS